MNNTLLPLQNGLEQESALVQQFISVLQAETKALIELREAEALQAITQEKTRFAGLLGHIGQERGERLAELGFAAGQAGLDAAVAAHPDLQPTYRKLLELARQASALNTSNGAIIDIHLQHNQRAVDTLQRLIGIDHLYDASGRAHSMPAHKPSIKAG